jgi:hypothetical protein
MQYSPQLTLVNMKQLVIKLGYIRRCDMLLPTLYLRDYNSRVFVTTASSTVSSRLSQITSHTLPQSISNDKMSSKLIAIVAGVGAGTGASVAKKFATAYPVVLLARKPENYEPVVKEINAAGGKAIGISTDISDSASVQAAVAGIKKEFGEDVAAAVCT